VEALLKELEVLLEVEVLLKELELEVLLEVEVLLKELELEVLLKELEVVEALLEELEALLKELELEVELEALKALEEVEALKELEEIMVLQHYHLALQAEVLLHYLVLPIMLLYLQDVIQVILKQIINIIMTFTLNLRVK
jgi:hypothetical protein